MVAAPNGRGPPRAYAGPGGAPDIAEDPLVGAGRAYLAHGLLRRPLRAHHARRPRGSRIKTPTTIDAEKNHTFVTNATKA